MVYNFYPNFVFIGGKDNTANAVILEQYNLLSKSVGMNIAAYTITDVNDTEIVRVAKEAFKYAGGEGSYIISAIDNEAQLKVLADFLDSQTIDDAAKISMGFLYLFNDGLINYMKSRTATSKYGKYSAYIKVYSSKSTEDMKDYDDLLASGYNRKDAQMENKVYYYYIIYDIIELE